MTRVLAITSVMVFAVFIGYAQQSSQTAVPTEKKTAKSTQQVQSPAPSSATSVPGKGGAVVVVDPVTHQIREATPEEIGALSSAAQGTRNAAGAARASETANTSNAVQGAGGAVGVTLGPEFDTYVVVTKTPDGKLKTEEVTGAKTAQERVLPGKTPKSSDAK